MTGIQWTDRTWNPTTGCDQVSRGCDNCYAMTMAKRLKAMGSEKYQNDGDPRTSGPGFAPTEHPGALGEPLRWRKPSLVFVNSMSDLFHDSISDEFIAQVFAVMAYAHTQTFQILTKRHARMRSLLSSERFVDLFDRAFCNVPDWAGRWPDLDYAPARHNHHLGTGPLSNVWLGVSAEDQKWANIRIPALVDTPAAVRFVSAEPLLGPIDLSRWLPGKCLCTNLPTLGPIPVHWRECPALTYKALDWVIAGGESGHGARPMHPDWPRSLRDQCDESDTAFLFKQWGAHIPTSHARGAYGGMRDVDLAGQWSRCDRNRTDGAVTMQPFQKALHGRDLDGRTWDQYPEVVR